MPQEVLDYVAARIKELRTTFNQGEGLPQQALAEAVEVATNTISRWETGLYRPSIEDLEKLARFFHVSILSFFPPENAPEPTAYVALRRAMTGLKQDDVQELVRYAEFRRARNKLVHEKPRRQKKAP